MTNEPIEHHAHLGTGNGLVQFVCCGRTDQPFDVLWTAPVDGISPANVFHSPRQAYDMVVAHLTRGNQEEASLDSILESADRRILEVETPERWRGNIHDVRPAIEYVAEELDSVHLDVVLH